eukprot:Pgem_evm1s9702
MSKIFKWYVQTIEQKPLLTNMITAGCVMFVGDSIAQNIEKYRDRQQQQQQQQLHCKDEPNQPQETFLTENTVTTPFLDWQRSLKVVSWNAFVFSPVFLYWFGYLDRKIPGNTLQPVVKKVLANHCVLVFPINAGFLIHSYLIEKWWNNKFEWEKAKLELRKKITEDAVEIIKAASKCFIV